MTDHHSAILRPVPLKQRIPSPARTEGAVHAAPAGNRRRNFFSGHLAAGRRKRRSHSQHQTLQQESMESRIMPSIWEEDRGGSDEDEDSDSEEEDWFGMGSRIPGSNAEIDAVGSLNLGGFVFRRRRRTSLLAVSALALAGLSCLSLSSSATTLGAVGRHLSGLGRLLSGLVQCDPTPYVSQDQARAMPPTPLPGAELDEQLGNEESKTKEEEYVPSHIAMCKELQRRHDLTYGDAGGEDPDAVAERFPPFVVSEHEGVCASWEAPHFHLMEMLASTFLGVYGDRYNVAYRHNCDRTRTENHGGASKNSDVATQRDRNLSYRSAPQLSASAAHLQERASLDFDTTSIQQILPDVSLLLDRARTTPDAEREVLALCRGCLQEHDALRKAGVYSPPPVAQDGVEQDVQDQKAREYNDKMNHVSHECLLYPGGKSGEAAKAAGGNGVALSALRPIVVTLLRHAAMDWRRRARGPKDESRSGAVVYVDDASSVMPAKVYADRIPQSVKTITVLVGPLCGRRPDCFTRATELSGFLRQLYPGAIVDSPIVASTAAAFSRMILSKHLVAPPNTVAALLPALAKPAGTYGTVGESDGPHGTSTAHWYGDAEGGPDDGSKVGLAWCVTPACRGAEDDEDDGSKVGLTWGLPMSPTEEEEGEDDESKVGLGWGANLETIELTDEEIEKAEEEGYGFTPEEEKELEEKWDRPVELKPEEYWTPPPQEDDEPQQAAPKEEEVDVPDMSVEHAGTEDTYTDVPGTPGTPARPPPPNVPAAPAVGGGGKGLNYNPGGVVYNAGGHSGYTATGPVIGCTHARGRLGQWQSDGTWRNAYPECALNVISLPGLCNVVTKLGLGRVMFVGDRLQGSMVRSMHKQLGLGDVDPAAMARTEGLWSKNVHCPAHGRSFELAFAHNDRMATQQVVGPARVQGAAPQFVQNTQVANQCGMCSPWVQSYAASPVRTFLVACPCAACAHDPNDHPHRGLKGLFSKRNPKSHRRQERELKPDDVQSDLARFLSLVREVGRPDDAVFVRTAAPTYCRDHPRPDASTINEFNDRVHDAVYEAEWGRTHTGPPGATSTNSNTKDADKHPKAEAAHPQGQPRGTPTYLLDVAPMTQSHPDSTAEGGVDCDASEEQHVVEWWNHLLYSTMIDLARREDPNFRAEP